MARYERSVAPRAWLAGARRAAGPPSAGEEDGGLPAIRISRRKAAAGWAACAAAWAVVISADAITRGRDFMMLGLYMLLGTVTVCWCQHWSHTRTVDRATQVATRSRRVLGGELAQLSEALSIIDRAVGSPARDEEDHDTEATVTRLPSQGSRPARRGGPLPP